jgi:hypothetical protein
MGVPPTLLFSELGSQAKMMSKECQSQRMAIMLNYVAIGCMILMTGLTASQVLREAFGSQDQDQKRGR